MMTPDEMIEVIQAYKEGKELETKRVDDSVWQKLIAKPSWNFTAFDYRVKPPGPKEFWVVGYKYAIDSRYSYAVFETEDQAIKWSKTFSSYTILKLFRTLEK